MVFDRAYNGTLHYAIHDSGTGVEGADFASIGSGAVSVNGASATIPITSIENSAVDPHRLIMIDLVEESDLALTQARTYRTGGRSRHVLCLGDNDHFWSGVLSCGLLERNFRIKWVRDGGVSMIQFVAGSDDGLPADPSGAASSQSIGVVPEGSHRATIISDSPSLVDVMIGFPAIQKSKLFGDQLNAVRVLTLEATNGATDPIGSIEANRIVGSFTETVGTDIIPNVSTTSERIFVLVRNPSATSNVETPFVAIP
ncbi:MAG: hypothetical protein ACI8T1_004215 [Verrucomicrobiales bacterium]